MNWHFAEYGTLVGPLDDAQFQKVVEAGRIKEDTLVWREDLPEWTQFRNVKSELQMNPLPASETVKCCVKCRRDFRVSSMIQFGGMWVCADCKPNPEQKSEQKLGESGAAIGSAYLNYGGFWHRVIAAFLDTLIIKVALTPVHNVLAARSNTSLYGWDLVALYGLQFFIAFCYIVLTTWIFSGTLGKLLTGLRVVHPDGSRIGFNTAFMRYFANYISGILLGIGYIMVGLDDEKRALHDRICNTRVIVAE
jgi:uncharacterized RDD family membrane protein YckC